MEGTILPFTEEDVLFSNYEDDDLVGLYISNIFTFYFQEQVIHDINENGFNEELFDLVGSIDVSLPKEIIDYYRDVVDLNTLYIPEEKKMVPLKMNKSTVHKLIMDNMNWFEDKDNKTCWLSCSELEEKINQYFQKKAAASGVDAAAFACFGVCSYILFPNRWRMKKTTTRKRLRISRKNCATRSRNVGLVGAGSSGIS